MEPVSAMFAAIIWTIAAMFIYGAIRGYDGSDDKLKKRGWTIRKTQFNGNVYSKGDLKTDKTTALEFEKIKEKDELGFVDPPKNTCPTIKEGK